MTVAARRVILLAAVGAAVTAGVVACGSVPFTLAAAGPFTYAAAAGPSLERVAIVVTITNRSSDDLLVNPADFAARDADHRIYAANAAATVADVGLVSRSPDTRGTLPLPVVTLRQDDVLTGFVVFDLPVGVRPVELVWRQTDNDYVARLSSASPAR